MSELADATTRGRSAADHLAAEIERMHEGDRLGTKKELCQRLGVANATLNEAIRLLQERGLVTLRPGPKGGIFVTKADPFARLSRTLRAVRDEPNLVNGAIEVRESLRALAAQDALRHRTDDDVTALREHLAVLEAAVGDHTQFLDASRRLQELIGSIGENRVLQTVYSGVLAYLEANDQSSSAPAPPAQRRKQLRTFTQLVDAIVDQDEKACQRAVRALHR